MSILGVNNFLPSAYQYADKSRKTTANGTGFTEKMQTGKETAEITDKRAVEMLPGDVVVPQPPNFSGFTYNRNISNKPKEEMTLDEYKQWVMKEMSQMPVSAWYRSTCVGGALTITEKAFEKMKSNPEWEKTVMNMVREMHSTSGIMGSKMIGFQVIGASPQECYGEGIPVDNNSGFLAVSNDGKSWWQKRFERTEELSKEQSKKAVEKLHERQDYQQQIYGHRWKMLEIFNTRSSDTSSIENVAMQQVMASAIKTYEKNFMDLSGNQSSNMITEE